MKPLTFFKKLKLKSGVKSGSFHVIHSPARDWQIVAGCGAVLLVCLTISAYLFFQKVSKGEIFQVAKKATNTSGVFDGVELKNVTDIYVAKRSRFEQLQQKASRAVDPSL